MAWTYDDLRRRGLTEGQVRWLTEEQRLDRPFHSVYLPANQADDVARLRALFVRLPPEAALTRRSAAQLHGFGHLVTTPTGVEISLPAGVWRPRIRGVRVHETALPVEPVLINGIPCVPVPRCAVELARTSRRLDALAPLDGALRTGCTPEELAVEIAIHSGLPGIRQARELLPLADPGAQCRQESQLRLVVIDGGLPRPETQLATYDDGGWARYYLDLGWRARKVGAEYDGVSHLNRDRARRDRERHNWLAARGWRMRYFTDLDLYQRPRQVVAVLRDALS